MNLLSFDLNLLKVLDALLTEGSTTRAGQRVGLSQPAVSAALGRLRHALGDELFVRRGQGIEPTDFARALAAPLREALDHMQALLSPSDFDPASAAQTFRISGLDYFAEILVPRLYTALQGRAPGIRLQHLDLVPDASVEMIDRHKIDFGLMPDFDAPDWIEKAPLGRARFVLMARREHPRLARAGLRPGDAVPIDLFCDLPHVLCSPDGRFRGRGDDALAAVGRERRVVVTTPFFSGAARLAADSDAVTLLPDSYAAEVAPRLGLEVYEPPMRIDTPLLVVCWHRRSTSNPAHAWMRGLIVELLTPFASTAPAAARA